MRHVTHMNVSRHMCEWVKSHIRMSHATHMNKSRHTSEWVMSHIWTSHVTHMNESCHTNEWVMSHIRISHATHMNKSRHTYDWVMSHIWTSHVSKCRPIQGVATEHDASRTGYGAIHRRWHCCYCRRACHSRGVCVYVEKEGVIENGAIHWRWYCCYCRRAKGYRIRTKTWNSGRLQDHYY